MNQALLIMLRETRLTCAQRSESLVKLGMERSDPKFITRAAMFSSVEQAIESLELAHQREPLP